MDLPGSQAEPGTLDASDGGAEFLVVAPRRGVLEHLQLIWRQRELLGSLVRRELKVKYKNSSLGFVWSLLNPVLYLVVYYYVFQVMLGSGIENFPIFLLSGLLIWSLFATSLSAGTTSMVANGALVKKVYFPREILPLAAVGAALVHFLLQFLVLLGSLVVFQWSVDLSAVWLVVPALFVTLLLAAALAILLSAVNVYARDTQHLLEIVTLLWFWLTPIVYPFVLTSEKLSERGLGWLPLLNPMTSITLAFQRAVYGDTTAGAAVLPDHGNWWYLRNLGVVGLVGVVLLWFAIKVFDRAEGNFAEEM